MDRDPRTQVEAPVRGALVGVMGRGMALVGVVALLAMWPLAAHPAEQVCQAIAVLALGYLVGYGTWVRVRLHLGNPPTAEERASAWARARAVDGDDAALSLLVAGWVPVGLLIAIGILLWPNVTDPHPSRASAWVVLGVPPFVLAWLYAVTAWLDACRDDLARAEREAETRLRHYWADLGH